MSEDVSIERINTSSFKPFYDLSRNSADCGNVFLKIPGRSKIVIVLPGLFLIHVCCSGPQIFLRGPNTVRSSGCNLMEQCVGEMVEELLHYLYSSPADLLQGENSAYQATGGQDVLC